MKAEAPPKKRPRRAPAGDPAPQTSIVWVDGLELLTTLAEIEDAIEMRERPAQTQPYKGL